MEPLICMPVSGNKIIGGADIHSPRSIIKDIKLELEDFRTASAGIKFQRHLQRSGAILSSCNHLHI